MKSNFLAIVIIAVTFSGASTSAVATGDAARGAKLFRQCAACHSIVVGEHLTGPSLAGIVGRKAGSTGGFGRYSPAMRESEVTWTRDSLDSWLESPTEFIPGTSMRIQGIDDGAARRDIIAYLESAGTRSSQTTPESGSGGGMMTEPGALRLANLKEQSESQRVVRIRHCGDAYHVTLGTSDTYTFWEFNLRFKTDSSVYGPSKGKPAILRGGMMGDRAFVIFAGPEEISAFIDSRC